MQGLDLDKTQAVLSTAMRRSAQEPQAIRIVDTLMEGAQSQSADSIRSEMLVVLSTVKSQLGTFARASSGLTMVLDELGKIHPFVQIAVIPFKVALTFKLKRVENDKKVLALFVQMNKMMENLRLLDPIKPLELGDQGKALAGRLEDRLKEAANAIQECSHGTNEYYKTKFVAKLVKSGKWEEKFARYARAFAQFTNDFQSDLQIYTGTGVQVLNRITGRIDEKVEMLIKLVFETLVSPEEQELKKFMGSNGGPEKFMDNDKLLRNLILKRQDQLKRSPSSLPQSQVASQLEEDTFKEIKEEVKANLDSALNESKKLFDQKFKEQRNQFEEVKNVMRRESDRIIKQFRSGAHDRIIDKVMHQIWVYMGWKGSVKARHLVLALRDFYIDRLHFLASSGQAISEINNTSDNVNAESHSHNLEEINQMVNQTASLITDDDRWAIGYISIFRLQPLLEALDPDYSGLVTITEANDFTAARPDSKDWTLPRWLAYWTVGFQVTLKQYCSRIREVFSELASINSTLLPGNAGVYSRFLGSYWLVMVDQLVAGICTANADNGYEDKYQHPSFKEYVTNNEKKLKRNLNHYEYCIDDTNAMALITGPGRLEEHVLILIYLLIRQALRIMEQGRSRILPSDAFENISTSLRTITFAVNDRTRTLQSAFKLLNFGVQDELRKYCDGLYYYFVFENELYKATGYYNMPGPEAGHIIDTADSKDEEPDITQEESVSSKTENPRSDINLLDIRAYEKATNLEPTLESEELVSTRLVGEWNGLFNSGEVDIPIDFSIDKVGADGSVGGSSRGSGYYSITGTLRNSHVSLIMEYLQQPDAKVFLNGELSEDYDTITGEWGFPAKEGAINGSEEESEVHRTFKASYKPSLAYVRFRPSDEAFQKNKAKALWKFALDVTRHDVSNGLFRWPALRNRRDHRQRFITLFMEWEENGLDEEDADEFGELYKSTSSADLSYYLSLAKLFRGREVVHTSTCDVCSKSLNKTTRSICIDCWELQYGANTLDLCNNCVEKEVTVTRNGGALQLKHVPTHRILQVRHPLQPRRSYVAREKARNAEKNALEREKNGSTLHCGNCDGEVKRPYWSCGDCHQTFICMDCNKKTEDARPWLFEARYTQKILHDKTHPEGNPGDTTVERVEGQSTKGEDSGNNGSPKMDDNSDDLEGASGTQKREMKIDRAAVASPAKHHWSHDLILCQPAVPMTATAMTIEERFEKLEKTFQEQLGSVSSGVKDITGRLERLEDLTSRLRKLEGLLTRLVDGST